MTSNPSSAPSGRGTQKPKPRVKRTLLSWRESATRLQMALDAAGMVTWEWDLRTDVIRYSQNVNDVARGKDVGVYATVSGLLERIHPDDREILKQAIQRAREGFPYEAEYRVMMQDGQYYWILGKGKSVNLKKGKPIRVLGISQDITRRKQDEQEIYKRSQQLVQLASELTLVEHRERRRLAETLHENLQQILVAACLEVESLATSSDRKTGQQGRILQKMLNEALSVARSMTQDLAPPVSMHRNLPVAFDWLAHHLQKRYQLNVDVHVPESLNCENEPIGVLLFTAARELLLNVIKHSGQNQAKLSLHRRNSAIVLEVVDHGSGFKPDQAFSRDDRHGFGLFSIRERAELFGGRFEIQSKPGHGTRVKLELPIKG